MNQKLRFLSSGVIAYMLMALAWWAILLYRKNGEVFQLESKLLQERYVNDLGIPTVDITTLQEFAVLQQNYNRQMNMIIGEAVVFGIMLVLGVYFINRAYRSEIFSAQRHKNFLLSTTHELKSPLASINLVLGTLKRKALPHEKVVEISEDGLKESKRLESLFDKILFATKVNKSYQFNFEEDDISKLVQSEMDSFKSIYADIDITSDIAPKCILPYDKESIVSVVRNLIENAIKYGNEPAKVYLKLTCEDTDVVFAVHDNGAGVPKEERKRVFEQFYRVGSEETRKTKGTGLGLYIVKQIIDAHQGKITIGESKLGGAEFMVSIPKNANV